VIGNQTFGKGSVQTKLPLGNNAGLKLTTARYFTPAGRSIQAKGIEPDINVDDGRESRIREANLERHLETNKIAAAAGDANAKAGVAATPQAKPGDLNKAEVSPLLPRFEFGAADDFQLQQARNHLKGAPVIASTKAVAANTAVPAPVKP
jgi:carboxyl-terminal processing protease